MHDPGAKLQRQHEVAKTEEQGFPNPDFLPLAVEYAKVQGQQNQDKKVEAEPHPEGIQRLSPTTNGYLPGPDSRLKPGLKFPNFTCDTKRPSRYGCWIADNYQGLAPTGR